MPPGIPAPRPATSPTPPVEPPIAPAPAVSEPSPFPGIQIDAGAPRIKKETRKPSGSGNRNPTLLLAAGGVAALLVVIAIGVFVFNGDKPASIPVALPSAPRAGAPVGAANSTIVLDWSEAERKDGGVTIDGQRQTLPAIGALRYDVPAGDHRLVLQRRGYEPQEVVLSLKPGDQHQYAPQWSKSMALQTAGGLADAAALAPVGFSGWSQNFELAQKNARERGTEVLVIFSGSDWEPFTQRLSEQIFAAPQFLEPARKKYELVVIDFPRTRAGYNLLEDSAQNGFLQRQFSISSIPMVALADPQGLPYAVERPSEEGVSARKFLAWLEGLRSRREERDRLLAAAREGDDTVRLEACVEAVEWMVNTELSRFYTQPIDEYLRLAQRIDPRNELGQHEVVFQAHWINRLMSSGPRSRSQLKETAAALEAWVKDRKFQDPDRAAGLYLAGAAVLLEAGDEETALKLAAGAARYAPKDKELAESVAAMSALLKDREQLGSGTGFVVAAEGHILTNQHVIDGPGRVVVRISGRQEPVAAQVLRQDEERDLALLKIDAEAAQSLTPLVFEQAALARGARVAAFGYPLGDIVGSGIKLTTGVVSALPETNTNGMLLLDCRVNPGNSGGPLCNTRGQIVGIVTAKSFTGNSVDSYGMAVPTGDILPFLAAALPGFRPMPPASTPPLEWDEVDRLVSPSVVMVLKLR